MEFILILTVLLVGVTVSVGVYAIQKEIQQEKVIKILGLNMGTFLLLMIGAAVFLLSGNQASAETTVMSSTALSTGDGMKFIGAALSTGMACIGAGIAVASSGAAAIGAISENAKLLGKTIIFVGLSEGIAIYGLIISIMILG
jgi:V/A-type H+/Na+-transporting ATPase subunit K